MNSLVKTDFARVFKDKLFLIMCILGVVFALITPCLYLVMFSGMGLSDADMAEMQMLGISISAKSQFFDSFSFGNNFGLVVPVLLSIVLCKDFSHGTVRNKIISGKTRTEIFMSMYTVCAAVLFGVVFCHALITLGFASLFFPFQDGDATSSDFGYFVISIALELLLYLAVSAIVCLLCASMKNAGVVVVMYVAIMLVMTLVASLLQVGGMVLSLEEGNETAIKVMEFFNNINIFNFATVIGKGTEYETKQLLYLVLTPTTITALCLLLGLVKFNKKDLK